MPSNYRIVDARSGDDDGDDDDDTRQVVCVHECKNSPVNVCKEAFKPLLMTSHYFSDDPSGDQPCGKANDKSTWCSECNDASDDCTLGYSCDKECVGAGSSTTNCLYGVYQDGEHYFDIYSQEDSSSYYYGICEPCIYKSNDADCDKQGSGAVGYLMRKKDTDMPEQKTCSTFNVSGNDVTLCSMCGLKDKGKVVKAYPTVSATDAVTSSTFYALSKF